MLVLCYFENNCYLTCSRYVCLFVLTMIHQSDITVLCVRPFTQPNSDKITVAIFVAC